MGKLYFISAQAENSNVQDENRIKMYYYTGRPELWIIVAEWASLVHACPSN